MIPSNHGPEWALRITTAACLIYALAAGGASLLDARMLNLEKVWLKPLKFGLSTALYLGTLVWVLQMLSPVWRGGRAAMWIAATACFCSVFELAYIGIQAGRGQASHFNLSTPFYAAMYSLMALAAVALVLSGGALGIVAYLDKAASFSRPMHWAITLAFLMSTGLTIVTAITMGGRLTHHVGVEAATAVRLPLTGWSLTVGDMRVPHLLAMHLMQSGPLFAWLIARVTGEPTATAAVIGFCFSWAGLTLWLFRIVLGGRPFFPF